MLRSESVRSPADARGNTDARRLLVVNNLPAHYRAPAFRELCTRWAEATHGTALVAFQARRDPGRRPESFFSSEAELDFEHVFLSDDAVHVRGRSVYRPGPVLSLLRRYSPTHVLTAGWDVPASVLVSLRGRVTGQRTMFWSESTATTTGLTSGPAHAYRRLVVGSADVLLCPTSASACHATGLAGRALPVVVRPNPVAVDRLFDRPAPTERRLLFVGEFSCRKGFDRYLALMREAAPLGWTGLAVGPDREGLAANAPSNVRVLNARPFVDILQLLGPDDVWVVPSRSDPAPLTFSEAVALGLRCLLSESLAYADDFRGRDGVAVSDGETANMLAAVQTLAAGPRPGPELAEEVSVRGWANAVLDGLLEGSAP